MSDITTDNLILQWERFLIDKTFKKPKSVTNFGKFSSTYFVSNLLMDPLMLVKDGWRSKLMVTSLDCYLHFTSLMSKARHKHQISVIDITFWYITVTNIKKWSPTFKSPISGCHQHHCHHF